MSASDLIPFFVIAALVWFWFDGLKVRETAITVARAACARRGVQFLDETVALRSLRTARNGQGQLVWRRIYGFEYSLSGVDRHQGTIVLHGNTAHAVEIYVPMGVADPVSLERVSPEATPLPSACSNDATHNPCCGHGSCPGSQSPN
jgi:hypothetical protein